MKYDRSHQPAWHTHLRDELKSARIDEIPDRLFDCLGKAIDTYNSYEKEQATASLKKELAIVAEKTDKLLLSIQGLSDGARELVALSMLDEEDQDIPRSDVLNTLQSSLEWLNKIVSIRSDLPDDRSRPTDTPRLELAVSVAACLQCELSIRPTKTRNGLYEKALSVMLSAVTGEDPSDVHDLAMRAIDESKII